VACFADPGLDQQMRLRILADKLLVISQRFSGIPPSRSFALAAGIGQLLSCNAFPPTQESRPLARNPDSPSSGQPEKFWGKS